MWGGLMILTSRPYASCHQLSNGADVIIAMPPQAAMKAPSGPRNPQIQTEQSRKTERGLKVVLSTRYPQEMPARTPQMWIAMWAGVQNVSRPMDRCQEISQWIPTIAKVTAATEHQTYQGAASL